MEISPGVVVDRYTVEEQIGEGGMARVYRVRHNQLGTAHALKVLLLPAQALRERLQLEGRVQASLRHPNVVPVTDMIEVEGAPGLVMDYIDGPSLDQLLRDRQLNIDEIDQIAQGMLAGVGAAHKRELIHRDLKPANIMMGGEQGLTPKITDFGLAKMFDVSSGNMMTRSGLAMGTPAYMAPEQIRDAKNVDSRADIFSVGVILYELVSRRRAFGDGDMLEIFNRIATANCIPIREHIPDIPERMERAIRGAMTVALTERVGDCETLLRIWKGEQLEVALVSKPEVLSARDRSLDIPPAPTTPDTMNMGLTVADTREQIAPAVQSVWGPLVQQENAPTLNPEGPAPTLPPPGASTAGVLAPALVVSSGLGLIIGAAVLGICSVVGTAAIIWMETADEPHTSATELSEDAPADLPPLRLPEVDDAVVEVTPEEIHTPVEEQPQPEVAVLEVELPEDCGAIADLEGPARAGALTDEQIECVDGMLARSDQQTMKKKISLILLVNAEAAMVGAECGEFDERFSFHIREIDRSDPEFMYNWVVHLGEPQHTDRVRDRINWSNRALEAKAYWPPSVFSARVSTLHRARTMAAYSLYLAANQVYLNTKKPSDEEKRDVVRLEAKNYSVEWISYDNALGKDISKAVEICSVVAGIGNVCSVDGDAATEPVEVKGRRDRKKDK